MKKFKSRYHGKRKSYNKSLARRKGHNRTTRIKRYGASRGGIRL